MQPRNMMIMGALLGLAMLLGLLIWPNSEESQAQHLKVFLNENQATPEEREAYFFALQQPEVLKAVPCYCGCTRQGHKSNYSCFVQEDKELAKAEFFDQHGLYCPMCVQIALNAKALSEEGVPLDQIREQVDEPFKKYPHLHPTPTPKPAAAHH